MNNERYFKINTPAVVSEIIDGEAVIMNLQSGHYYSTQHSGCLLWQGLEQGKSDQQLLADLSATFDADPPILASTLAAFLDSLLAQELISATPAAPTTPPATLATPHQRRPFSAPVLNVYTDMQDLLLLDPIHDVADSGWPTAKPAHTSK